MEIIRDTRKRTSTNNKKIRMQKPASYNNRPRNRNPISQNKKRKLNKKKVSLVAIVFLLLIILIVKISNRDETVQTASEENTSIASEANVTSENQVQQEEPEVITPKEITDWRLTLANYENPLPEDFEVEVANIDDTRQFDARAIGYLNQMMNDMKKDGIANIWVQSAYRSVERQKELYNNSVNKYLAQGKTQEEAEKLTDEYINKPGTSEHNLGLAVDFNYVDNNFEDLKGFEWLQENAENYGFILRYPKDKEDITKISYESWHWRYVGEEHAKKMNKLNMCLEEYIEYLKYEEAS